MSNNIAVSITADVADLTAKMAVAKATMQDTGKALRDVAKQVAAGDNSAETATRVLALADAHSKAAGGVAVLAREQKKLSMTQVEGLGITGSQRAGIQQLTYNLGDMSTMYAMGAKTSQIFASQMSQTFQAITLLAGESSSFAKFLGGPWGIAAQVAAMALIPLAGKLFETEEGMKDVKFAGNALGDAQSILGGVLDITTGKVQTQSTALIALARAQLAVAKVQSQEKEAQARRTITDSAAPRTEMSGGFGGGISMRRVTPIASQIESNFRNGVINADQAVKQLERLQQTGRITTEEFTSLAKAYANLGVEILNQATYAEAEKLLDGKGGRGILKPEKARTPKKESGPDQISVWETQLKQQQAASDQFETSQIEQELSFWKEKLALTKNGSKEWLAVQSRVLDASRELEQANKRSKLASTRAESQQTLALAEEAARTETDISRTALQSKLQDIDALQQAGMISSVQAVQQAAAVNAQILALDGDLEMRLYAAKLQQLNTERSLYDQRTQEYADFTRRIELLNRQHLNRMRLAQVQADNQRRQSDRQVYSESNRRMQGMAGTWGQNLARMATLQQGFGATVKGIWQGLVGMVTSVIEQIVTQWIIGEMVKLGLMKMTSQTTIAGEAAKAGAGGTASMAAAPFPLNLSAPAFGASMYASAMAYSGAALAGFAKGTNELPTDMIAQIHAGERIVPKADNDTLIELTKRGAMMGDASAAGAAGGMQGGGSDGVHVHLHGTVIHGTRELKKFAESNAAQLSAAGRKYLRNNGRG